MSTRNKNGLALVAFGVICLFTAMILSIDVGKDYSRTLSNKGGVFGPIKVTKDDAVYEINVYQPVAMNQWSYVEVEVLDANKEYLYSFSDELWKAEGYDDEGYWSEAKYDYDMEVVFPKKGDYYLNVVSDSSMRKPGNITVTTTRELGSNLGFIILGILSPVLGFGLLKGGSDEQDT